MNENHDNERETLIAAVATALKAYTNAVRSELCESHTMETQRCFRKLCSAAAAVFDLVDDDHLYVELVKAKDAALEAARVYHSASTQALAADAAWAKAIPGTADYPACRNRWHAAQEQYGQAASACDRTSARWKALAWLMGDNDLPEFF
jgi:hypothetical protein